MAYGGGKRGRKAIVVVGKDAMLPLQAIDAPSFLIVEVSMTSFTSFKIA